MARDLIKSLLIKVSNYRKTTSGKTRGGVGFKKEEYLTLPYDF